MKNSLIIIAILLASCGLKKPLYFSDEISPPKPCAANCSGRTLKAKQLSF